MMLRKVMTIPLLLLLLLSIGIAQLAGANTKTLSYTHSAEYNALLEEAEAPLFTTQSIILNKVILVAKEHNIRIFLLNDESINAYTDGKNIYLNSGIIKILNDKALTIVILHEIGHIANSHMARHRAILMDYLLNCLQKDDMDTCSARMRTDAHLLKVSRGFEYEADMYAFQHASDYNITWETCYDLFSSIPSGNVSDKMSTHPMTSKRQTQCVEYIKSGKEAYSPDYETLRETTPELITF